VGQEEASEDGSSGFGLLKLMGDRVWELGINHLLPTGLIVKFASAVLIIIIIFILIIQLKFYLFRRVVGAWVLWSFLNTPQTPTATACRQLVLETINTLPIQQIEVHRLRFVSIAAEIATNCKNSELFIRNNCKFDKILRWHDGHRSNDTAEANGTKMWIETDERRHHRFARYENIIFLPRTYLFKVLFHIFSPSPHSIRRCATKSSVSSAQQLPRPLKHFNFSSNERLNVPTVPPWTSRLYEFVGGRRSSFLPFSPQTDCSVVNNFVDTSDCKNFAFPGQTGRIRPPSFENSQSLSPTKGKI
jgi:hypothetical protein